MVTASYPTPPLSAIAVWNPNPRQSVVFGGSGTWNTNTFNGSWTSDGGMFCNSWNNTFQANASASFSVASGTVTVPGPVSVGTIIAETISGSPYIFTGIGPINFSPTSRIHTNYGLVFKCKTANPAGGTTTKTGPAAVYFNGSNSIWDGKIIASEGTINFATASTVFGTTPVYVADKLTLDGATLSNFDGEMFSWAITVPTNFGITIGPGGGAIDNVSGVGGALGIDSKIVGPGLLTLERGKIRLAGINEYAGTLTSSINDIEVEVAGASNVLGTGTFINNKSTTLVYGSDISTRTLGNSWQLNQSIGLGSSGTGTLVLSGNMNLGTSTKAISAFSTVTHTGIMSNTAPLTVTGGGKLTLSGNNTHSGAVTVTGGTTLNANHNNALGATANLLTIDSLSKLELTGGITITNKQAALNGHGGILGSSGALVSTSGTNTYNGIITCASTSTIGCTAGSLTLPNSIGGNFTKYFKADAPISVSGTISGSATDAVRITGSSTTTLTGANTFNGNVIVESGKLVVGTSNTLNTQPTSIINGTGSIELANGTNVNTALTLSNNTGPSGANSLLSVASTNSAEWSGTITITATPSACGTFRTGSGTLTISGALAGAPGFIIDTGNVVMSGGGTHIGASFLRSGTLKSAFPSGIPQAVNLEMGSAGLATLDINGFDQPMARVANTSGSPTTAIITNNGINPATLLVGDASNMTFTGVISNGTSVLSLTKKGTGQLTLGTSTNTYTGTTTIAAGILRVNSHLSVNSSSSIVMNDATTGTSNTTFFFNCASFSFVITPPIIVNNQGTGITTIEVIGAGSLYNISSPLTLNKATTLRCGGANALMFNGVIGGSPGTITIECTSTGSVNFNNTNTFTGNIDIAPASILRLGNGSNLWDAIPSTTSVAVSGTLSLRYSTGGTEYINALTGFGVVNTAGSNNNTIAIGDGNGSGTFFGTIVNGTAILSVTKRGTGAQILAGACTYTGNTLVENGILEIAGSIQSDTTVAAGTLAGAGTLKSVIVNNINTAKLMPGSSGDGSTMTLTGSLSFGVASVMEIRGSGSSINKVSVATTTALGGHTINVLATSVADGTYPIIVSGSTMSGTLPILGTNASGKTITFQQVGNTLNMIVAP